MAGSFDFIRRIWGWKSSGEAIVVDFTAKNVATPSARMHHLTASRISRVVTASTTEKIIVTKG